MAGLEVQNAQKALELRRFLAHEAGDLGTLAGALLDACGAGVVAGAVAAQQELLVQCEHIGHGLLARLLIEPAEGLVCGVGIQQAIAAFASGKVQQLLVDGQHHELGAAGGMKNHVFAVQLVVRQLQCCGLHGLGGAVVKGQGAYLRIRQRGLERRDQGFGAVLFLHVRRLQHPDVLDLKLLQGNEIGGVLAGGDAQVQGGAHGAGLVLSG